MATKAEAPQFLEEVALRADLACRDQFNCEIKRSYSA
jgi:hypothetical protein